MKHSEKTLEALSRMQYDLFCQSNRIARTVLSFALIIFGVLRYDDWWGILLIGYGCYLTTSTYASSNRTAHRIADQIRAAKVPFPSSRYRFEESSIRITPLPEAPDNEDDFLPYSQIFGLGEDYQYYYIFRDRYGGYLFSKSKLGEQCSSFRDFVEKKTGKQFILRRSPLAKLQARMRRRENEPYHL